MFFEDTGGSGSTNVCPVAAQHTLMLTMSLTLGNPVFGAGDHIPAHYFIIAITLGWVFPHS